ncbi:hypothetical protein DFH11DRAFT_1546803 [Phellopilus nigrolimitatus]|nr:hypothetical protein DFH11DRAFT_1546803 [Phellopilus nigrolimitatus]
MSGIPGGNFAKKLRRQMKGTQTRSRIVLGRSTSCSIASIAQDNTAYDRALSSKIRAYRQRARGDKPAKHKSTVFKDADVDDDIDEMNVGYYSAEDSLDFRDFKRIVVAEMPIASERFRNAMDAQRTNRLFATNNGTSAAATNAHSNDGVYVAEVGGAVTDRITAQDNIPEGNGASSLSRNTEHRATLAGNLADGDSQQIKEATVFGNSVSHGRKRSKQTSSSSAQLLADERHTRSSESISNADEEAPRTKRANAKRAKAVLDTRIARNKSQAAQPIDDTTEDTGPRTRARTKATQPNNPTIGAAAAAPIASPAAPTAPADSTSASVRTQVQPAKAARPKAVPVTRKKTTAPKAKGKARASAPSPELISVVARAKRRRTLATIEKEESVALLQTPHKTRQKAKAPAVLPSAPAPAPPAKPVRKTRQKAAQAPVAPPPVPAPPAEPVDPSKTRTLRSKRTCALEVPKPKPRTRRAAQQTGALSSEEAGESRRKPTAGQKRHRDDDDAETPAPTKRRKPAH